MWRAVHDVCEVMSGYPFRARVISEPERDVAVLQVRDVEDRAWTTPDRLIWQSNRDGRFDKYLLAPGDVLFQSRGTRNLAVELPELVPATPAYGIYYLRHRPESIIPAYLTWCLNHPRTQRAIREIARGSTVEFVAKADLANVNIPVPALDSQRQVLELVALRARERELAERLAQSLDQWTDAVTWRLAAGPNAKKG